MRRGFLMRFEALYWPYFAFVFAGETICPLVLRNGCGKDMLSTALYVGVTSRLSFLLSSLERAEAGPMLVKDKQSSFFHLLILVTRSVYVAGVAIDISHVRS